MRFTSASHSGSKHENMSRSNNENNFAAMEIVTNAWTKLLQIKEAMEDPTRSHWLNKMGRGRQKLSKVGNPKEFGSYYNREPGQYSVSKFTAEMKHFDHVRTIYLRPEDRAEQEAVDDDSHKESDWFDRTSISPNVFKAQKDAQDEINCRRESTKRAKRE